MTRRSMTATAEAGSNVSRDESNRQVSPNLRDPPPVSESTDGEGLPSITDEQIQHMVERFLGWKLPENFNPDCGISFKAAFNEQTAHPNKHEPRGTNLFDADQARAMVRYMVEGMSTSSAAPLPWQPIETAPKDGSFIWVSDGFFMRVGYWYVVTKDRSQEHWADMALAECGGASDLQFVPTLWQHLPKPPTTSKPIWQSLPSCSLGDACRCVSEQSLCPNWGAHSAQPTGRYARLADEPLANIPDGYAAPMDDRTTAEMIADRQKAAAAPAVSEEAIARAICCPNGCVNPGRSENLGLTLCGLWGFREEARAVLRLIKDGGAR